MSCEQSANPEMDYGPLVFRDKRIRGLLDPVVQECVIVIQTENKSRPDSVPKRRVNLILRRLMNQAQRCCLCIVPETGKLFQNFPCPGVPEARTSSKAARSVSISCSRP